MQRGIRWCIENFFSSEYTWWEEEVGTADAGVQTENWIQSGSLNKRSRNEEEDVKRVVFADGTKTGKECPKDCSLKHHLVVGNLETILEEEKKALEGVDVVEGFDVIEERSGYLSFHQILLSAVLVVMLIVAVFVCSVYEYRYSVNSLAAHKTRININVWNPNVEHIQY